MKKALPVFLILTALTNMVGFMPLYFSLLQEIKGEVELQITEGKGLQKLYVSNEEYNNPVWFKKSDDNEFSFKGQLFDYKEVKKVNGGYIFYAMQDDKETELIGFLKATFGQSNDNDKCTKGPLGNLLKNFSKDFIGSFCRATIQPSQNRGYSFPTLLRATSAGHLTLFSEPPNTFC